MAQLHLHKPSNGRPRGLMWTPPSELDTSLDPEEIIPGRCSWALIDNENSRQESVSNQPHVTQVGPCNMPRVLFG